MFDAQTKIIYKIAGFHTNDPAKLFIFRSNTAPTNNITYSSGSYIDVNPVPNANSSDPILSMQPIMVGFGLVWGCVIENPLSALTCPGYTNQWFNSAPNYPDYHVMFQNPAQKQPIPQNLKPDCGIFGNPNADGKCEDLIHEMVSILEYN